MLFAGNAYPEVSFSDLDYKSEAELIRILEQAEGGDRGRVHTLVGRLIMDRDPQQSRKHLQSADALIPEDDLTGRAYLSAAWCWLDLLIGDIDKARQKCMDSVTNAERSGDFWVLTKAYSSTSGLHYQTGELQKAAQLGLKALDASMQVGITQLIASQYNTMGLISRAQGMFQTGLDYFASGLEILDPIVHEEIYRILSFNVGIAYADLGQHEIAQDYYADALEWAVATKRYSRELTALTYNAMSDNALGQPQKVIDELGEALERPELRENHGYLAFAYAVLGEAHLAMGDFEEALLVFERGMRIAEADPNTFEQRRVKTGYARALFETGNLDRAREVIQQTIEQLRRENSRTVLLSTLDLLSELEESVGNYAESLAAHKESAQLARDFQDQALDHQLATMRSEYELDEKERELAQARQDTIILYGLIGLVIALAFIGYLGVTRRTQRQRAEAEAKHAEQLEEVVAERTSELEEKIEQANVSEAARIALERQLSEAEKLRVLGQLTGGVAHDFNNLLTVVIGAAELLQEHLGENRSHDDLINHIITAAASGADITRALMAYARKQPLQLETVVLNEVLRERVPLVARTLGGMVTVQLELDICPDLNVVLDRSQLTSAILNLTLNARDAQNSQGEIKVGLDQRDGRWAVIKVKDSGCGMSEEQIKRAVEPFYTTKDEAHGSGLGLSMVYGFSKQLGGDLEIDSEIGVGTEVRIILPLAHLADSRVYTVDFGQAKS